MKENIYNKVQNNLLSGESQTVEFKTSFSRDVIETLVAFANTQGGLVLDGSVDQAMKFIVSHVSVAFTFDGSLQRKERFAYIHIRKELETYPELTFRVEKVGGVLVTFEQAEGVSEGVSELLNCISKQPGLRLPEISEHLQVPVNTLERRIKQLRDENKVIFKGAAKTGGYYVIAAEGQR
jgi:predicted HTH transcriptional regulator